MNRILAVLSFCSILTIPADAANVILYDSTANPFAGSVATTPCPCGFSFSAPAFASNLIDVQASFLNQVVSPEVRATPLFGPVAAGRAVPDAPVAGSISVFLYSNNPTGPQPASQLIALGSPLFDTSLTSSATLYDFPPASPFPLTPNARYWVEVTPANSSIAAIAFSNSAAGTGVVNEFIFGDGSTFPNSAVGSIIGLVVATPTTPGVPVPPSVILTLMGLACVGFYVASRRLAAA